MVKLIRKQIDIDSETLRVLKILAAMKDTNPKKYIEDILIQHVKTHKLKSLG
jgi:hypothetical protein